MEADDAKRAPCASRLPRTSSPRFSTPSSSLTAMRRAWKIRVAGCRAPVRGHHGSNGSRKIKRRAQRTMLAQRGDACCDVHGSRLLAVFAEDPGQFGRDWLYSRCRPPCAGFCGSSACPEDHSSSWRSLGWPCRPGKRRDPNQEAPLPATQRQIDRAQGPNPHSSPRKDAGDARRARAVRDTSQWRPILIERDHLGSVLEKFLRVAASACCAIQENEPLGRAQKRHHFLRHNRNMVRIVRPFQSLECGVVEIPGVHKRCGGGS